MRSLSMQLLLISPLVFFIWYSEAQLNLGNIIIFITFLILFFISEFSIIYNRKIYDYLYGINNDISTNPNECDLLNNVLETYNQEKKNPNLQINISAFIESYMSEYKLNSKFNIIKRLKMIQTFTSITILIGVLGTFIGLVFALQEIDASDMSNSIVGILSGVHTAFYTSICGILYSMCINLHSKIINSEQLLVQIMLKTENYIYQQDQATSERQVVLAMSEVKEAIENVGKTFIEVKDFSKDFKKASKILHAFNHDFGTNTKALNSVFSDMEKVTQTFNERSSQIHQDVHKLFDYYTQQEEIQNKLVHSVQQTSDKVSEVCEQQHQQLNQQTLILKELSDNYKDTYAQFSKLHGLVNQSIESQRYTINKQKEIEDKNLAYIQQLENMAEKMEEAFNGFINSHNEMTTENSKKHSVILEAIQTFLRATTEKMDNMFTEFIHSHTELMNENKEIQKSVLEAVYIFEQYKLNNEKLTEIADKMEQTFEANYSQIFNQNITLLKELEEHIAIANENVNTNFKDVLDQFKRHIKLTNEIIEKKFDSIISSKTKMEEIGHLSMEQYLYKMDQCIEELKKIS